MLTTIVIFIIILGIMVFVHELGHFWTARKFGVKCHEFGFGFPPRICGWRKVNGKRKFFWGNKETSEIESEDTIYSVNWIPLGGFVKIKGEDGENAKESDSFGFQKLWKRVIILSAGVTMNVLLCMLCLMIAFMIGAPQVVDGLDPNAVVEDQKIQIVSVIKDSPAGQAGIEMGDVLLTLNDQPFENVDQVQAYIYEQTDQNVNVKIRRINEEKEFQIVPIILAETEKLGMGVGLADTGIVRYPWYQSIWLGIKATVIMAIQIVVAFATIIKNAFVGDPLGVEIAGPVGIAVMTGQVARMGFIYILQFTALLSLNLAIINFLPIPALDGGRVLFLIVEKIRGKAANQKFEQITHGVGFILLMLLILVVTGRDVMKFKQFFIDLWLKIF